MSTAYIDGYALYSTLEPSHFFDVTRPEAADHNMAALDTGRAVAAIRQMRLGFKRPEKAAETLLLEMEADGLIETVDPLRGTSTLSDYSLQENLQRHAGLPT